MTISSRHTPCGAPSANYRGPKRSLVLSGGGVRLSYQAGVIRALIEHGLVFHHLDGTSGGSLNLSMLLSGLSLEEMCQRWRTQNPKHFMGFLSIKDYLDPANLTAAGSADGVLDKVFPHLGIDAECIRRAAGLVGTYNVLNYNDKRVAVIEHTDIETDLIVAGMSLPGVMPPVVKNGITYLDTGFMQDANPLEAVRRGAEEIWLVWGMGNTPTYRGGGLRLYVQMLEMSANGALNVQMERIAELNRRIANGDSPYGQTRPVTLHVIRPDYPLPLDSDLFLGHIDHATLIHMGYADARCYLATMKPEGIPPSYKATQMQEAEPGVRFRESMSGGFSLGADDPKKGAERGKANNTEFTIQATIDIKDVEAFVRDPEHTGTLIGSVNFTPLGGDCPVYNGAFNLFFSADDPDTKLIIYELTFDHDGKAYRFSGNKEVRDDPGFDLLSDITTLYATLHEGPDKSGPIIGAGVLKLNFGQLAGIVKTITATNASGVKEKARVLRRFGTFFLGELWEKYARFAV
ncbi:MAG: patatin-like phospholipase family protein [Gemmatimonadetes bacterium]|nr:patatin-like phospholipase family protein [Gemmatimonadota bacterium]